MLSARNTLLTLTNQHRLLKTRSGRLKAARDFVVANLDKSRLDLERTEIAASVTGMIVADYVEEGSYVQRSEALYKVEDTSAVEVKCTLRMDQLYWLWNSQQENGAGSSEGAARDYQLPPTPATVVYRLQGREYYWQGALTRYDGIGMEERTRTVPCRVIVNHPRAVSSSASDHALSGPKALVRGMYVSVILHAEPDAPLVRIPEQAVKPGNLVWRVVGDRLSMDRVNVVRVVDGQAFIESEDGKLSAGDRVVTTPIAGAHDGMLLEVVSPVVETISPTPGES